MKYLTSYKVMSPETRLVALASQKFRSFTRHTAYSKSKYFILGPDLTIRLSDHSQISGKYPEPQFNFVAKKLTYEHVSIIESQLTYAPYIQQAKFGKTCGKTWRELKKILSPDCYMEVALDPYYYNTMTKVIKVDLAVQELSDYGITDFNYIVDTTYTVATFNEY
jgi:hypothetical protein